ncbi:hypothetical protein, partial [Brachyspira hyodysenteriae]|uniref:hypothetical protein n=1 Tax=Brachyspira hyodysenteriae TaxID=159 RepID=UPI0015C484B2
DYLSSFLLYAMVVGGVLCFFIIRPALLTPSFTIFIPIYLNYFFPILFFTVSFVSFSFLLYSSPFPLFSCSSLFPSSS